MSLTVHHDAVSLRRVLAPGRGEGKKAVGFVPTMGYLHEGHAALIRRAAELAPEVVVSIFVNPMQFGPKEDFARYPRDLERDVRIAAEAGATQIYAPSAEVLTPPGLQVTVDPGALARVLCGKSRPGHFRGVTTIVTKLFNLVAPDVAVFGWKDAQQLLIIRKMVEDLNIPVRIEGVETMREPDGLAMSSRNTYLSPQERREAPVLYQALQMVEEMVRQGENRTDHLCRKAKRYIEKNSSAHLDYIQCRSMTTLSPIRRIHQGDTLLALAAWFGKTRLIDNVRL